MSITCKFELARASNIYYSGEQLEGTVTLCPHKVRQAEAIILQFYGQTKVAWLDLDKTAVADHIVHNDFSTQELAMKTLYSNQQKHVCEHLELATEQLLQPHVDYRYKFSLLIPQQAAATSRCPLGECEYGLRVIVQHPKKVNKEFHQRIVVKNKLDLSQNIAYQEPRSISSQNDYGQIVLTAPCTGFTPGQKVPYLLKCRASQANCKILVQLTCFISCRSRTPRTNLKHLKQTINLREHSPGETIAHLNIPLDSQISRECGDDLIMKFEYHLEALIIEGNKKKILMTASLPLMIGTTPCLSTCDEETETMCFDNLASFHGGTAVNRAELSVSPMVPSLAQQLCESMWLLPLKRKTHLQRSLRYCYKKIVKLI